MASPATLLVRAAVVPRLRRVDCRICGRFMGHYEHALGGVHAACAARDKALQGRDRGRRRR